MARSRRKFKAGKPKVQVGLKRKKKKAARPQPVVLPGRSEIAEWDEKATLTANYRALGLAANPNFMGGRQSAGAQSSLNTRPRPLPPPGDVAQGEGGDAGADDVPSGSDDEPDELRAMLGKRRKAGPEKPPQRLTHMQRVYVRQLIAAHGDDVEAMSRDRKLNRMQHTAGALRALCRRLRAYEKAAPTPEAEAGG